MKPSHLLPILLLASCASGGLRMSPAAQQQTLAKGVLNQDVRNTIAITEQAWGGSCASPTVSKVVTVKPPRPGSGAALSATEHWHVDRCGKEVVYEVKYNETQGNGTAIGVKLISP